jgi:hypothetical protein
MRYDLQPNNIKSGFVIQGSSYEECEYTASIIKATNLYKVAEGYVLNNEFIKNKE